MLFNTTHLLHVNLRIGEQEKKERMVALIKISMCNHFFTTHQLNLRIGLENRKKKKEWLLLTNCPHEINVHFIELTC